MNLSVLINSSKNDGNGWVGLSSDIKQIDEIIDNLALQFDATIAVRHTTANIFWLTAVCSNAVKDAQT